jgi:hypothetical protein
VALSRNLRLFSRGPRTSHRLSSLVRVTRRSSTTCCLNRNTATPALARIMQELPHTGGAQADLTERQHKTPCLGGHESGTQSYFQGPFTLSRLLYPLKCLPPKQQPVRAQTGMQRVPQRQNCRRQTRTIIPSDQQPRIILGLPDNIFDNAEAMQRERHASRILGTLIRQCAPVRW